MSEANQPSAPTSPNDTLLPALVRLSVLQREPIDRLALEEAVAESNATASSPRPQLQAIERRLQLNPARWFDQREPSSLPALVVSRDGAWGILRGRDLSDRWVADWYDTVEARWSERVHEQLHGYQLATFRLTPSDGGAVSPVIQLAKAEILANKGILAEAVVGGFVIACLALLTSFYTMQVYDRVIPVGATQTLLVLTLGILVVILLDYVAKRVRSRLYETLIERVDRRLAQAVYQRFLSVRLDQLPNSVGTLAGQLKGYESLRVFLVSLTSHVVVDLPFALLFIGVIAMVGGVLAWIPFGFLVLSLVLGALQARKQLAFAKQGHALANRQTGLLVESVEAAEIIKSGQGGWRMLGEWLASSDESRDVSLQMRRFNEANQFRAQALQQISYVSLIAFGAVLALNGQITMGALVAVAILSSRVLNPLAQIGHLLGAWANVKASVAALDAVWRLEGDHHGQSQPVHLDAVTGCYRFEKVAMEYRGKTVLTVDDLEIQGGEKIGILGPVGSGKTTLLRLLSGMYRPTHGRIWLDDVDLSHLAKPVLADALGYLPQEGRLVSGSLRDNLLLGLKDEGDQAILEAAKITGLYESVIASHPRGLEQPIFEGGTGLSGGQRQLVNLTRVFLRQPKIWLLDEPSASLDRGLERQIMSALQATLTQAHGLIVVTHKPEILELVDRVIVVRHQKVVMDGPKEAVLAKLRSERSDARRRAPLRTIQGASS